MKKNDRKFGDFYLYSDLNYLSFYLYCPSYNNEQKKEISNIVINNNGVRKYICNLKIENHFIFKYRSNNYYRK